MAYLMPKAALFERSGMIYFNPSKTTQKVKFIKYNIKMEDKPVVLRPYLHT